MGVLRIEGMLHIYVFAVVFTTYISVRFIRLCRGISRYIHIFSHIETRIGRIATFYVLYPDLPRYLKSYIVLLLLCISPPFKRLPLIDTAFKEESIVYLRACK